jgi:hypothetical protein
MAAFCLPSAAQQTQDVSVAPQIDLPGAVQERLSQLPIGRQPVSLLKLLRIDVQSGSKAERIVLYYERLESGLWGVGYVSHYRTGGIVQRWLSLQGLVSLAGTMETANEMLVPIFIPGTRFLPFGKTTSQTTMVFKTEELGGALAELVSPQERRPFAYHLTHRTDTTSNHFPASVSRTAHSQMKASCEVHAASDARALNARLRGSFLPVTCSETRSGKDSTRRYAYLIESQLYVPTYVSSGGAPGDYRIVDVEYLE